MDEQLDRLRLTGPCTAEFGRRRFRLARVNDGVSVRSSDVCRLCGLSAIPAPEAHGDPGLACMRLEAAGLLGEGGRVPFGCLHSDQPEAPGGPGYLVWMEEYGAAGLPGAGDKEDV